MAETTYPRAQMTMANTSSVSPVIPDPTYNPGDVAWSIACTCMVWLMVPGIGFFYSGLARSKTALSLIILSCWSLAVVSVQWFMFGYTLAFSETASNHLIGDFKYLGLANIHKGSNPANKKVPSIVFCLYQQMLAGITPALVIGATAERGRILPTVVFMFLWTTFVYDFLAYWTWADHGWMNELEVLDFAGGTCIHIAAGSAAIAYAMILGERESSVRNYSPHSLVQVVLGTSLIWFGWFGFNGGSVPGANTRSAMVIFVTNLSASVGGITWTLCDYYKEKKFSGLSFCFGAVAGLVSITPASGYIAPWSAVIFGFVGAFVCHYAIQLKDLIDVDDAMDVAAVHGVCGLVGTILTGVFAQKEYAALDGITQIKGGWLDGHFEQVLYQLAGGVAGLTWSFVVTYVILWLMNKVPGLLLRLANEKIILGVDKVEMGESAYEKIEAASQITATSYDKIETVSRNTEATYKKIGTSETTVIA